MTTQEKLEAFAPYLPYELKCICHTNYNGSLDLKQTVLAIGESYVTYRNTCNRCVDVQFADIKPIFHPLSDLTKPCIEGGKVPIVELAKIISNEDNWILEDDIAIKHINRYDYYALHFDPNMMFFSYEMWSEENCIIPDKKFNQKLVFDQLYMWHFWLGDQSEFGKSIIDINTINNENR